MKITCPSCQTSYQMNDSKIPDKGIYGRCSKCQQRFLIKKETNAQEKPTQTPEEWAKEYMSKYTDAQPEAKRPDVEKAIKKEENKKDPPNSLGRFFHTIRENKQKTVLFATAGILALMLLFPPFHIVVRGTDRRVGYAFFYTPPPQYNIAKIDAVMLLVQCLIVAVIGMICWLAFRKDEASESFKEQFVEQEKGQTGVPPPTEDLKETSVKSASSTQPKSPVTSVPQGVGGWLVFFCICLTIFGPLYSLGQMALSWEQAPVIFARFPSFKTVMYVETFGVVLILLYGFIVGCKIWGGNPDGERLAKQYLKIRLFGFIGVEAIVILLMLKLPSQMVRAVAIEIIGVLFREGVFFLLWWLYFKKSKRVRSTYGSNSLRKTVSVNRWTYIILIFPIIGIFLAILIPQFAADNKRSPNLQERSGSHDKTLSRAPSPTEIDLSKQRMVLHEENYKKILADNPDRDPYVLEQGMEAMRGDPISPYNYATVENLERDGRDRIRKAAQKLSEDKGKGCIKGDCKNGHGAYTFSDGDKYVGQFKDGKKHGYGTYTFLDGRKYVGEWKNNEYLGPYTLSGGRSYFGQWKNNAPNGHGTMTYPDGSYTVGEWKNGQPADILTVPAKRKQKKTEVASLPQEPANSRPSSTSDVIEPERLYVAYANGIVRDTQTRLEWQAGPDKDTTWSQARSWVQSLNTDSSGWRMPTVGELKGLYKRGTGSRNMTPLLKTTGFYVWTRANDGLGRAISVNFNHGISLYARQTSSRNLRAFAVRSRSDG